MISDNVREQLSISRRLVEEARLLADLASTISDESLRTSMRAAATRLLGHAQDLTASARMTTQHATHYATKQR
jgi:hypothetical protein